MRLTLAALAPILGRYVRRLLVRKRCRQVFFFFFFSCSFFFLSHSLLSHGRLAGIQVSYTECALALQHCLFRLGVLAAIIRSPSLFCPGYPGAPCGEIMTAPYQVDFFLFACANFANRAGRLGPVKGKRGKKKEATERTSQVSCTEYLRRPGPGPWPPNESDISASAH